LYFGYDRAGSGRFVSEETEYQVEVTDPTGDLFFSSDDVKAPGFFTLKRKERERWVDVPAGPGGVQIGNRAFRVAFVSDDGALVEFEAARGRR
jgi:hypothetical protein